MVEFKTLRPDVRESDFEQKLKHLLVSVESNKEEIKFLTGFLGLVYFSLNDAVITNTSTCGFHHSCKNRFF